MDLQRNGVVSWFCVFVKWRRVIAFFPVIKNPMPFLDGRVAVGKVDELHLKRSSEIHLVKKEEGVAIYRCWRWGNA